MAVQEQTRTRQIPEYGASKVTDLPEDVVMPRSGPRTPPSFTEAMLVAQADPEVWYCVATYKSDNGAKTMAKRIDEKKVKIPKGDWEIETRRIKSPDGESRWSKLYARFLG